MNHVILAIPLPSIPPMPEDIMPDREIERLDFDLYGLFEAGAIETTDGPDELDWEAALAATVE